MDITQSKEPEYQNILHQFRTYAYHHIFIACDSSDTATALSASDQITNFQHRKGKPIYEMLTASNGGKYIVIIDGTTDTMLYIEKFSTTNVIVNDAVLDDGRQDISAGTLTAEMTIVESNGATFYNTLANICGDLGQSPSSIFFLIKTIFLGYADTDEVVPITDISPFVCTLLNSSAEFTTAGATYQITFAGAEDGIALFPHITGMPNAVYLGNQQNKQSITLAQALTAVISQANVNANTILLKMKEADSGMDEIIQPILFDIDIDPVYSSSEYLVLSLDERTESDYGDFHLATAGSNKIETMLQNLIQQCPQVTKDRLPTSKPRYQFDMHSVRSSRTQTTFGSDGVTKQDTPVMLVKYVIRRKVYPVAVREAGSDEYILPNVLPQDVLNLKYIFTGKNVDILDFNMVMQYGNLALLNIPSQKTLVTPKEANNGLVNLPPTGPASTPPTQSEKRIKQHMSPAGTPSNNPLIRNTRDPAATSKFYAIMSQSAQTETIQTAVKIHGNPRYLSSSMSPSGGPYEFVTIDIKMPDPEQPDVLIDFWFRGFYRVLQYEALFEHGLFTVTLQLNSVASDETPYSAVLDKNTNNTTSQPTNASLAVLNTAVDTVKPTSSIPSPNGPNVQVLPNGNPQDAELSRIGAEADKQIVTNVMPRNY